MRCKWFPTGIAIVVCLLVGVVSLPAQKFVRVNQLGYSAALPKVATAANLSATSFEVRRADNGEVAYRGSLKKGSFWNQSRETIQKIDFSDFNTPGTYILQVEDEVSYPFKIEDGRSLYGDLSSSVVRAFYFWRASQKIESPYSICHGTDFARAEGHPDTMIFIHRSAATEQRRVESVVSSPKGWYDAGDYNKYVVNAGITLHQLFLAYELNPDYFTNLRLNVPKDSTVPCDYLAELKWELDWLFTMQDPSDGGVYHKLTSLDFCDFVMPDKDETDRYVVAKSTAAALDFAAEMAMCARTFRSVDTLYAAKALQAAERAWKWAERNPSVLFENPSDVLTGPYSDNQLDDELFWAAAELFITTGEKKYYDRLSFFQKFDCPTWREVNSLGLISLRLHLGDLPDYVNKELIDAKFKGLALTSYNQFKYSPGRVALRSFVWGCNGDIAMNGVILGLANRFYKDAKYLEAMTANLDYLLGANPTGYCFVTGFGTKYPKNLHDRRIYSDGIVEPIPGYLCGGANASGVSDCGKPNYPSTAPARCYLDEMCSYSTNEIAINWNAPLVFLVSLALNI